MDWSIDSIGFYVVWAIMVVHEQYFSLFIIFTSSQTKSKIISLFFNLFFSFSLFTLFYWVFFVFYYNIKGETGNVATFRLPRLNAKIKKNKQTNKQKYLWKTWFRKKKTQYPTPKKKYCSSETRTRELWTSKPVRYPLGQYVLELKKAYFL